MFLTTVETTRSVSNDSRDDKKWHKGSQCGSLHQLGQLGAEKKKPVWQLHPKCSANRKPEASMDIWEEDVDRREWKRR